MSTRSGNPPAAVEHRRLRSCAHLFSFLCLVLYMMGYLSRRVLIDGKYSNYIGLGIVLFFLVIILSFPVSLLVKWIWEKIAAVSDRSMINAGRLREKNSFSMRGICKNTGLLLLLWSPYFVIRFPGNADFDTFWQLMQIYGFSPLSDGHPLFDTLLFGLFWKIGDLLGTNKASLFLYCSMQMMMTAWVLSFAQQYCLYRGLPEKGGRVITAFYAFFPAVPLFAQTMAKDMLHGPFFVLFSILFYELASPSKGREIFSRFGVFLASILGIFLLMLTKKTGIYIVLISLAVLLVVGKRRKTVLLLAALPLILYHGFYWAAGAVFDYAPGGSSSSSMLSVPTQQVASLIRVMGADFSEDDWAVVNTVYRDAEELGDVYVTTRADSTLAHWKEDATKAQKNAFFVWYLKQLVRHPLTMTLPVFAQDYPLFCVDTYCLGDESLLFYLDEVPAEGDLVGMDKTLASWSGGVASPDDVHRVLESSYRSTFIAGLSQTFTEVFLDLSAICPVLLSKCLFALWLPLFAVLYKMAKNGWKSVLMDIPILLNLAVLAVGPIVLPRYMVNTVYTAPIVAASMFWPRADG